MKEMSSWKTIITLALVFIILGIIHTYPLVSYFRRGMPYSYLPSPGQEVTPLVQGDYLQLYYKLWLFKDAVVGKTPFFSDPYQFRADPVVPSPRERGNFSTQFLPMSLLFLIFSVFGEIFAYNALIILSFVLSGLGTYLLVHFYTKDKCSAIIGGIIFAIAPFRIGHLLAGHPGGFLICLVPFCIYFLEMGFFRKSFKYSVFSGLCLLSVAPLEMHLTYYLFIFLCVFILFRAFQLCGKEKDWWKGLLPILFFMLLSLALILLLRNERLATSMIGSGRKWSEVRLFSPRISDILRRNNTSIERNIYPGIVALPLVLFGFSYGFFRRKAHNRKLSTTIFYTVILAISFILALGPSLTHIIPLYKLCYDHVPYYNFSRTPGRAMVMVFLSMSILAGFGVRCIKEITRKLPGIKYAALTVLLLGTLADYHTMKPIGISLVYDTDHKPIRNQVIYEDIIRENIGDKRLLELPIWPGDSAWSAVYLYYATITRAGIINGYSSTTSSEYIRKIFAPLYYLDFGEMRQSQYELLKRLNVKYITLRADVFPYKVSPYPCSFTFNNLKGSRYLKFIVHEYPVWLFELLEKPLPPDSFNQSSVIGVVYEAERLPHRTGIAVNDPQASGESAFLGRANKDRENYLFFGPYRTFPTGKYNVAFRLKVRDNRSQAEVAKIDISTDKGRTILAGRLLKGTDFSAPGRYQEFLFPIDLNKPERLEFRTYFCGNVDLWTDYVYVSFRDQEDPGESYEAEDLFHVGLIKPDKDASAGQALFAGGARPDYLISGPYRRYPKGKYTAFFHLKTEDLVLSEVARVEVRTSRRRKLIASRGVNGADFANENTYQAFPLPFELHKPEILEFLVFFTGKTRLAIDKIDISHEQ